MDQAIKAERTNDGYPEWPAPAPDADYQQEVRILEFYLILIFYLISFFRIMPSSGSNLSRRCLQNFDGETR